MNTVSIGGTANANFQNQINVSVVFNFLKQHGPTYRAHIARSLGLSAPAVSRAIEQLVDQGYAVEAGTTSTESGKRVTQIAINHHMGTVVAVDLLKGDSRYGIFDFDGETIFGRKGLRYAASDDLVGDLSADLSRFLLEADGVWERSGRSGALPPVKAICIGIPAAVNAETGMTTGASLFEALNKINLKEAMERRFDVRCYVENDVKLAAFAENRFGQGTRHRDLVYIDINDGIGAGIILDNRIVRGAQGFAGEIGYFLSAPSEMEYSAVTRGYLENRASVEALGRSATEAIRRGVKTVISDYLAGTGGDPRPRHVFEAALVGDELARTLISRSVDLIAVAIHNVTLTINPEVIVIGGDICEMPSVEDLFVRPLRLALARALPFAPPDIVLSSLGADACVTGASVFAVESLLSGKYPFTMDHPVPVPGGDGSQ
jgi:N-acetylglucosamine repressor